MSDKLADYRRADAPLPNTNRLWPLYGAGLDNMGHDGQPIDVPMPEYGPDELMVRCDACSLCFSDTKVIRQGQEHARIYRDMRQVPVILGHEVSLTVVGVGKNLRSEYHVGDRFTLQPDVWLDGVNYAFGYEIEGGLQQYLVVDHRILDGDHGNYLIPLHPSISYSEGALVEPWSCVVAAYYLTYRTSLKDGGTTWIIGTSAADSRQPYTIGAGFDQSSHPARLLLTGVPPDFAAWLRQRADELGVQVTEVAAITDPSVELVDDIVVLGADPDVIEAASPHLAKFGIMAIVADTPLPRQVEIDVGRVHYNRWLYVGGPGPDVARAYSAVPVCSELKPGGRALFVGAGGPMGRMHVQRAIQKAGPPSTIVCTDVSPVRLDDLRASFAAEAAEKGIDFVCLNPTDASGYRAGMAPFEEGGFDDVIVLVPIAAVITEAATHVAPQGAMNVFAGAVRGTMISVDLSRVYLDGVRYIGHTSSVIDDMRLLLKQTEAGELSPNDSVAAIGSLDAAREGMRAMMDTVYPGKIVIYPQLQGLPITGVSELKDRLPAVHARLKDGSKWTQEAEEQLLRELL
jgi:threonine dehydrogenase-like Zn-dependent dehydrogenase